MPNTLTEPAAQIVPVGEADLKELSAFLCEGFHIPQQDRTALSPDALKWRYLDPRPPSKGPRSFVVKKSGRIVAHVGLTTTEFVVGRDAPGVPAVYMIEWLSGEQGGMLGAMLMLRALGAAPVQYSLGTTPEGRKVLLGCGFKIVREFPIFYKVFSAASPCVWRFLHGQQGFARTAALRGVDLMQTLAGRLKRPSVGSLSLRHVKQFGKEVKELFASRKDDIICTSRDPELLNYFLRTPQKNITGWLLERHERPVGFALLSVLRREDLVRGHVMDCFLEGSDQALWNAALRLLTSKLKGFGCDLARCMASVPWVEGALKANGFFRRGRGVFFLRDTGNKILADRQFFLNDLEGDASY